MSEHRAEAYQFFSRSSFALGAVGILKASSRNRPDVIFHLNFEYLRKPFELDFCQIRPERPSIGAFQYIDPDVDVYFSKRWPICLKASGTVRFPEGDLSDEVRRDCLLFLRSLLWQHSNAVPNLAIPPDQRATVMGYRREFFHSQFFDIRGNRRPSGQTTFVPSEIGEPIGPGLTCFPDLDTHEQLNELVWSPILTFPNRSTFEQDKPRIKQALDALRKHYNSYSELNDAWRHLKQQEVKSAVRSGASAVDAYLRHLRQAWGASEPPNRLPFDEKIEHVLHSVNKASYKVVEPAHSRNLLYLYRARNSMHEGDCNYDRDDGQRVHLSKASQVEPFIEAVESFVLWADSVV